VLELVDLDADVVHDPQAAHALDQLLLLERVRRPRHDVDLHRAAARANQVLDDHGVLVTLVLKEQRVPRPVDEAGDPVPASGTPDEMALPAGMETLAVPIGFEAVDDLADF